MQFIFRFFGIMTTAAIATPFAIGLVAFVMILFLLIRWFFLKTSREIKRLEALGKLLIHFLYGALKSLSLLIFRLSISTNSTKSLIFSRVNIIARTANDSFLPYAVNVYGAVPSLPE